MTCEIKHFIFPRFYSNVAVQKQGQEIVDAITVAFAESLMRYYETNHKFPANIVVFRDGVGDGMMEATTQHEVKK